MKIQCFRCLLLAIPLFVSAHVQCQLSAADSLRLDSLKNVLHISKQDTNRANTLNEIVSYFFNTKDSAVFYAKQAQSLSEKLHFKKGVAAAYYYLGVIEKGSNYIGERGNGQLAIEYFNKAIELFKELNRQDMVASIHEMLFGVYSEMVQNFPEAEKNIYDAARIYEKLGNKEKIAPLFQKLGLLFVYNGRDSAGFIFLDSALKVYKEIRDSASIAYASMSVGMGHVKMQDYSKALSFFNTAMNIYKTLGKRSPDFGVPWATGNIAQVYLEQGQQALDNGNKYVASQKLNASLALLKERLKMELAGKMSPRETYFQLGDCYWAISSLHTAKEKTNDLIQSKKFYQLCVAGAKKNGDKALLGSILGRLAEVNASLGEYREAYENHVSGLNYRDSIFNEGTKTKSVQLQMQYDFDKKEALAKAEQERKDLEVKKVKAQQYFIIATLGILVLSVIIIAIIQFRNNKNKQKANRLLSNQKEQIQDSLIELRATQSQLIQSEKMASLGQLTAGIAHEIQNPLNFVNNFSDVNTELIDNVTQEIRSGNLNEAEEILNDIKTNEIKINHHGKRADAIVKSMLQHSRQGTGHKELTDINTLADEYLKLAYQSIRAKDKSFNATIKTDFDSSIGKINIIPQDIGRLLLNIYNNAFYAVNEKAKQLNTGFESTVSVSTKKTNDKIEIKVSDNGYGIPQNIIDKIFQPFFTTKPTGSGTGLGLSLAYDIAKAHGGEIKVSSAENEETIFTVEFRV